MSHTIYACPHCDAVINRSKEPISDEAFAPLDKFQCKRCHRLVPWYALVRRPSSIDLLGVGGGGVPPTPSAPLGINFVGSQTSITQATTSHTVPNVTLTAGDSLFVVVWELHDDFPIGAHSFSVAWGATAATNRLDFGVPDPSYRPEQTSLFTANGSGTEDVIVTWIGRQPELKATLAFVVSSGLFQFAEPGPGGTDETFDTGDPTVWNNSASPLSLGVAVHYLLIPNTGDSGDWMDGFKRITRVGTDSGLGDHKDGFVDVAYVYPADPMQRLRKTLFDLDGFATAWVVFK